MISSVRTDLSGIVELPEDVHEGMGVGLTAATNRGAEIMKQEAPELSGRLREGVKPHVDLASMRGEVEVSAIRPAQPAHTEIIVSARGRSREVKFAAQPAFDYSQVVAEGSGIFGARGQEIKPKHGKKLRFMIGGHVVFAGSVEGQRPNPYDERAGDRLELEVEGIVGDAIERYVNA
jgi:hypothetical protein